MINIRRQIQRAYKRAYEGANSDREHAGLEAAKTKFEELTGAQPEGQKLAELLADIR